MCIKVVDKSNKAIGTVGILYYGQSLKALCDTYRVSGFKLRFSMDK